MSTDYQIPSEITAKKLLDFEGRKTKMSFSFPRSSCTFSALISTPGCRLTPNIPTAKPSRPNTSCRRRINQVATLEFCCSSPFGSHQRFGNVLIFTCNCFIHRHFKRKRLLHLPEQHQPAPLRADLPAPRLQPAQGSAPAAAKSSVLNSVFRN